MHIITTISLLLLWFRFNPFLELSQRHFNLIANHYFLFLYLYSHFINLRWFHRRLLCKWKFRYTWFSRFQWKEYSWLIFEARCLLHFFVGKILIFSYFNMVLLSIQWLLDGFLLRFYLFYHEIIFFVIKINCLKRVVASRLWGDFKIFKWLAVYVIF